MRTLKWSTEFKRDYRRAKTNPRHGSDVDALLKHVGAYLLEDNPLPTNYRDHALVGNWSGYRECHLKSDLLLIYRHEGADLLRLARLGSHSELFRR